MKPRHVVIRIILVVLVIEFGIMLVLRGVMETLGISNEALVDAVLLSLLSAPVIYLWVVRPFVNERDQVLAELNRQAQTDSLTGLPNRLFFQERFGEVLAEINRHQGIGGLFMLDLDRFKKLNDLHGHDAGDAMLVEVARHIREVMRGEETIARLGGDEFVVLVSKLGDTRESATRNAKSIADKLCQAINSPLQFHGKAVDVGVSIGVRLIVPGEKRGIESLLRDADEAMYEAKPAGAESVVIH